MMSLIGKGELISGKIKDVDEITGKIEAITKEDVIRFARYVFDKKQMAFSLVSSDPDLYLDKIIDKFSKKMM